MIKDIDITEIVQSNKLPFGKQGFKYFIGYKDNKKIKPLSIFFHRWVCIKDILIKLNICILWQKMKYFLISI